MYKSAVPLLLLLSVSISAAQSSFHSSPMPLRRYLRQNQSDPSSSSRRNSSSPSSSRGIFISPAPSPLPSHLPQNTAHDKHKVRNWILGFIAGTLAGVLSGFVLTAFFRFLLNCIRGRYRNRKGPAIFSPLIKNVNDLSFLEKDDALASLEIIGRGGCGEVYKAELPSNPGRILAIKRIQKSADRDRDLTDEESRQLDDKWAKQMRAEIDTVGHIRHRNLLPLLAHVTRPDCHFLVYEFMKNGSLHDTIKRVSEGGQQLDWNARLKIARGIAAGLEYLHIHHKPHIIHRDLKPANILLDDDMEARIADFGLAKEIPDAQTHITGSNIAGTAGYIAPEYHGTMKFTTRCDIYSFGVILAVLVVGLFPNDDFFQDTDEMSLVKWLHNVMSSDDPSRALDEKLKGTGNEEQMLLVLRIACFCTVTEPKDRPNSKDVRLMLAQVQR